MPPESTEGDRCPTCEGTGWVTLELPVGHPEFGKALPCPSCQNVDESSVRLNSFQRYSNLGGLSRIAFAGTRREGPLDDPVAQQLFSEALPEAMSYAENPDGWLVLIGPSGSGKTHLAAAIANRCIERKQTTFFIVCADLLDHLRSSYAPVSEITYDELFEKVRNVPLLVLDDLGSHSSTSWAQEKLFQVVNHRYSNRLPMVVTLNGSLTRMNDDSLRTRLEERGGLSKVLPLAYSNSRLARGIGEIHPQMLQRMTFDNFDFSGGRSSSKQDRESLANAFGTAKHLRGRP